MKLFLLLLILLVLPAIVTVDSNDSATDFLEHPDCGVFSLSDKSYLGRVIGGVNAPKMWPWMVMIYIHMKNPEKKRAGEQDDKRGRKRQPAWTSTFLCGGAIIDENNILTAGHCLVPVKDLVSFDVHIGKYRNNNENKVRNGYDEGDPKLMPREQTCTGLGPNDCTVHENFMTELTGTLYDVAIIRLPEPLSFAGTPDHHPASKPICLPFKESLRDQVDTTDCFVTGWGALCEQGPGPQVLQQGRMTIADDDDCNYKTQPFNSSIQLCAYGNKTLTNKKGGGPQPCRGDSGGPLQCRLKRSTDKWVLMGVVNYGDGYCGQPQQPDYFAKVQGYLSWIKKNMKKKGNEKTTEKPRRHVHDMMKEDPLEEEEWRRWNLS